MPKPAKDTELLLAAYYPTRYWLRNSHKSYHEQNKESLTSCNDRTGFMKRYIGENVRVIFEFIEYLGKQQQT